VNPERTTSSVFEKQLVILAVIRNKVKIFSGYIYIVAMYVSSFTIEVLRASNSINSFVKYRAAETAVNFDYAKVTA
jgi:hypothetical protein